MELKDRLVLVTGADGFIGSHLVESLLAKGADVRALSYYNSFNNWGWLEDIQNLEKVEVWNGDIRDPHYCQSLCKEVEVIFHLAALIAIPYSYTAAASYVDTNVKGTLNLCQAALSNGCKRFIHASTSEVYGTAQYTPMDEAHPLQAQSPYSASKIGAEAIAMSFYYSYQLGVTIARPFNTYGPRQSARAVIPSIITQMASGNNSLKIGDLRPSRDFSYVLDTCEGFVALAECEQAMGEIVNLGTGTETSIGTLVETTAALMKRKIKIVQDRHRLRPPNSEVFRLCCDPSKLKQLTAFEAAYNLKQGLQLTIKWFLESEHLKNYKTHIYNV